MSPLPVPASMTQSGFLQILVRDVAVSLLVAGRSQPLDCLINLRLGTNIKGPFTGDPADIDITVDYSHIVRHILGPLAASGPFTDAHAVAESIASFVFAFDDRIIGQKIGIQAGEYPDFHCQIERERLV